jgi:hypothetical protein
MRILPCHIREGVHTHSGQILRGSKSPPLTLSFDGVHAAIESPELPRLDGKTPVVDSVSELDEKNLRMADGFASDPVQNTLYVNLRTCNPTFLRANLNRTPVAYVRHIIIHDEPGNNNDTGANALLRILLDHIRDHVAPAHQFSCELRGQVRPARMALFSEVPLFLTHIKIQDRMTAIDSIQTACHWAAKHKTASNLQCLMLDLHTKHCAAYEDDEMRCRATLLGAIHALATNLQPGSIKFSLTIRNFFCMGEQVPAWEAELLKITTQLGSADLIFERCNLSRGTTMALEMVSPTNNIFVHQNSTTRCGKHAAFDPVDAYLAFDNDHPRAIYQNANQTPLEVVALKELEQTTTCKMHKA